MSVTSVFHPSGMGGLRISLLFTCAMATWPLPVKAPATPPTASSSSSPPPAELSSTQSAAKTSTNNMAPRHHHGLNDAREIDEILDIFQEKMKAIRLRKKGLDGKAPTANFDFNGPHDHLLLHRSTSKSDKEDIKANGVSPQYLALMLLHKMRKVKSYHHSHMHKAFNLMEHDPLTCASSAYISAESCLGYSALCELIVGEVADLMEPGWRQQLHPPSQPSAYGTFNSPNLGMPHVDSRSDGGLWLIEPELINKALVVIGQKLELIRMRKTQVEELEKLMNGKAEELREANFNFNGADDHLLLGKELYGEEVTDEVKEEAKKTGLSPRALTDILLRSLHNIEECYDSRTRDFIIEMGSTANQQNNSNHGGSTVATAAAVDAHLAAEKSKMVSGLSEQVVGGILDLLVPGWREHMAAEKQEAMNGMPQQFGGFPPQ